MTTAKGLLAAIEAVLAFASICAFLAMASLTTLEIVFRELLNIVIPDCTIIISSLNVVILTGCIPLLLRERGHIQVDILSKTFLKPLKVAAVVVPVVGIVGLLPLLWGALGKSGDALSKGTYYYGELNLPEWPAALFFAVVLLTACIRLIVPGSDEEACANHD